MICTAIFFDWSVPFKNISLYFAGARTTIWIAFICIVLETIFGAIFGYIRYTKKPRVLYVIITAYVEFIRNTPLLVQLFVVFYGLPMLGILLNNYFAGIIALVICHSAYTTEVFRSGIQSINKGQWEAAACLGLSKTRTFFDVIMPQTLRTIFPTLSNQYIMSTLSTSLLQSIDVNEITNVTKGIAVDTFRVFENYTVGIAFYYVITLLLSFLLRYLNKRFFPSVSSKGE